MAKNKTERVEVKEEVRELTNLERARVMASEAQAADAARVVAAPIFDEELGELV